MIGSTLAPSPNTSLKSPTSAFDLCAGAIGSGKALLLSIASTLYRRLAAGLSDMEAPIQVILRRTHPNFDLKNILKYWMQRV